MARAFGKLSALQVARLSKRGMYNDGGGLYLQIAEGGSKSWLYRYKVGGKDRWHGVGPLHTISLAQARERAADARRVRLDGHDPIEAKRAARIAARLDAAKAISFDAAATAYISSHSNGWKNEKHVAQWRATLTTYVSPKFGSLPVSVIDTGQILRALEPIWATKPETASRLRGRIESVLDWAKVRGYRTGENPARWKGHLNQLLAPPSKVRKVEHHPALPYAEVGAFMRDLRERDAVAARALEFLILTVARTSETLEARWEEIDLADRVWTMPAERMKSGREHRVPLSDAAIRVLDLMKSGRQSDYVFPGQKRGRPLSNMAMLILLRRMKRSDLTAHGFRSTFRDWCAERTNFPNEVAEMALAHAVGDKVEAAYRRGDLFNKRRALLDRWAEYCSASPPQPT